jgi:hypothetical protein
MKTFEVIFRKPINRRKLDWFEASGHRINGGRLEFVDEKGVVIKWFDMAKIRTVCEISDGTKLCVF